MTEIIFEGKPLSIGDLFYDERVPDRVGKVIRLNPIGDYPIIIEWKNGQQDTYTADGRFMLGNPRVLTRYVQKEYLYLCRIEHHFFVTDDYFLTSDDVKRVIFDAKILMQIQESGRPVG